MNAKISLLSAFLICCLPAISQQLAPAIEWQKCLGGSQDDEARDIVRTVDNGFIIVGSSKSNNGDVVGHHGSTSNTDAWVVKISSAGAIQWQRSLGGSDNDQFNKIIATSDGNYIALGNSASTDGDVSGNHGFTDLWVVKMDRYGNILWQKMLGGSQDETAGSIHENADGSFYIIGTTSSNDGDVSGNHGGNDIWVINLSTAGAINWQRCFGGTIGETGYDIAEAPNNEFIISTTIDSDNGDFGMGAGNTPRGYIVKIKADKTMKWKLLNDRSSPLQLIKGPVTNQYYINYSTVSCAPSLNNAGALQRQFIDNPSATTAPAFTDLSSYSGCASLSSGYLAGTSGLAVVNSSFNVFAGGTGDASNTGHHGSFDAFIRGYNAGNVTWKKVYGGSGYDNWASLAVLNDFEFVVAGRTTSNNGDVTGNHGGFDFWIVKLGRTNTIKGTVFGDYNANGVKDANEPFLNNVLVQSSKVGIQAASSTYAGLFLNSVDTGTYSTKVLSTLPYYTVLPVAPTSSFTTYNNQDSLSFAVQPIPGKKDYRVSLYNPFPVRPGFQFYQNLQYFNVGTDTLVNKTIRLVKDSRLQFLSATLTPASISGDTISWNISTLLPRDTGYLAIALKAAAPPTLNYGDVVVSTAYIDSTGDVSTLNNTSVLQQTATGSFDPNDKQEGGGGSLFKNEYDGGKYLTYTIRFQNTGTDTAFNIVVCDTLQGKLDSSSLEMIQATHPYTLTIKDGKYCTWTFTNILLPDSNRNEPLSHGYITYRIKARNGLNLNDTIRNSASIYFDFNLPVKTNTQETVLKATPLPVPLQPLLGNLLTGYCGNLAQQQGKITNLPAAASGTTATAKLDATALTISADSTFSFAVNTLTAGAHTIEVTFSNSSGSKTTTHNFTITAPVTPDVNASTNITNVTNLSTPVIITAVNAAGGGTAPLYTFARNRNFTTTLQAEGSSSTLNVDPNNLVIGDNWIYVRMKSNAACITASTGIDSINIRRDQTTGIIDVDNPATVINVYPNPFKGQLTISGLQVQKKYVVTITNLQGQQLYTKKVSNRSSVELPQIQGPGGAYWLTIYDESRNRNIGSTRLIKQ